MIIVLFAVLLLGACDGASGTFLFLHLKNLGASQTVLGTYLFVKKASEIPAYVISGSIIRKLGHEVVLGVGFVVFGLRFLLYSFVSNPWWAVAIDTLNGYQAVTWAATTSYASISAQDELQTVAQAIVTTTFCALGDPLGDLVGGQVFDRFGAVVLFRAFAVSCLIGFILFYLLYICFGSKKNSGENMLTDSG
ncbi:major facilitator superfamily domain-containing protein 6-like [Branchiostoma floridae]|uniref:Major facilitator superfamily domain-containing protein 6-like n=1 Tax=Branchiostoma floridae TaxID=7739 RepID=A0A9J7N028_BRAFL|nr:major facilitator superfamily domain-containing protein 6-like [Branchiostoma floridae]